LDRAAVSSLPFGFEMLVNLMLESSKDMPEISGSWIARPESAIFLIHPLVILDARYVGTCRKDGNVNVITDL